MGSILVNEELDKLYSLFSNQIETEESMVPTKEMIVGKMTSVLMDYFNDLDGFEPLLSIDSDVEDIDDLLDDYQSYGEALLLLTTIRMLKRRRDLFPYLHRMINISVINTLGDMAIHLSPEKDDGDIQSV